MASKQRNKPGKSLGLFEDEGVLDDLLGDDDYLTRGRPARGGPMNRSTANDNFFRKLAEEAEKDGGNVEDSDISDADPSDLLKNMKDMDDMDADLFGSKKKPSSAPPQTKAPGGGGVRKDPLRRGGADEPAPKPSSAPASTTRGHKKFSFTDLDDPLDDLLSDPDDRKAGTEGSVRRAEKSLPSPAVKEAAKEQKKREELTFDEDEDDLMDTLGFDKDTAKKSETVLLPKKESSEAPQRPRTRLDDILQLGTSPRLLERPPTGERKDLEKTSAAKDPFLEDDLTFGSYQPTLGSTPEGRQSRRPSVRFSTEDVSASTPERKAKPTTPATTPAASTPTSAPTLTPTPTRPRASADWLGLKAGSDEDFGFDEEEDEEPKGSPVKPKTSSSSLGEKSTPPPPSGQPTETPAAPSKAPKLDVSEKQRKTKKEEQEEEKEEEDWLAGALSRKKTPRLEGRRAQQEESLGLGDDVFVDSFLSKGVSSPASRRRQTEDTFSPSRERGDTSQRLPSPAAHSTPVSDEKAKRVQQPSQVQNTAPPVQQQVTLSADSLQQLFLQQQLMQSQFLGLGGAVDAGSLQRKKEKESTDFQTLQARIIQLEGQLRSLQLERDQNTMLLESVQQRHKQDTQLMENTHRARVQLLEESGAQREARARQESEDLAERLAVVTRLGEQERSELQAQHQRRLAQTQQDRDREVERLRDLQRKSILEMKKDHEDQVQRLKRLKDEEIDAVTSATSQTRSLTVVIEQMEQFSHRLGDLSSRVESTHEHTAQGLEQGARQRDEQLRVMQDRLGQQQRAMTEERARLKEVITRMDTELAEQQRQLEKERWRVTAEQAKAESTQRGLEEERRTMTMHITMEREELERAKSALLEEQQSVMQRCAEERRKLAAEWSQFHTQEQQRQGRLEREASRALERDAQREGSIISMAQEHADLKLRAGELKQKEEGVSREKEALERQREELDREKERLSGTALRLKTRAQEVEAFSKLATDKYEEGERGLQEARQVETEHQARLRSVHTQMERQRQQEQHLHQERIRMTDMRRDIERLRQGVPLPPLQHLPPLQPLPPMFTDFSALASPPRLASTLNVPPLTSTPSPGSTELQARLVLLRHTAEKDRDYLQDEQFFLDTLKKVSHNSAFTRSDLLGRPGHFSTVPLCFHCM